MKSLFSSVSFFSEGVRPLDMWYLVNADIVAAIPVKSAGMDVPQ